MHSWIGTLSEYSYPVNLSDYERRDQFPGYFDRFITENRESTVESEARVLKAMLFAKYLRNEKEK